MWRPREIFFYDWWPIRRRTRVLGKLAAMPVVVRSNSCKWRAHDVNYGNNLFCADAIDLYELYNSARSCNPQADIRPGI